MSTRVTRQAYLSVSRVTNILLRVLPTRWRRKPAGMDMERNYVSHPMYRHSNKRYY